MAKNVIIVDIGSSFITIGDGTALVQRQPNIGKFIIHNGKLQLVSLGFSALKDGGSADAHAAEIIRPFEDGIVMNGEAAALIVKEIIKFSIKKGIFDSPRIYASISAGLSTIEKDETEKVFIKAGFKDVQLVESVLALLPFVEADGSAVAILGGGSFETGVVSRDGIVSACSLNISGETVNKRIIDRIFETFKLKISNLTAEKLKTQIGSLYDKDLSRTEISGRDVIDGKIKNVEVTAEEIRPAISYCYQKCVEVVESLLTTVPVTVLNRIAQNGLYLAGGGAELKGVEDFFSRRLKLPVHIISEPALAVARGLQSIATDAKYNNLF